MTREKLISKLATRRKQIILDDKIPMRYRRKYYKININVCDMLKTKSTYEILLWFLKHPKKARLFAHYTSAPNLERIDVVLDNRYYKTLLCTYGIESTREFKRYLKQRKRDQPELEFFKQPKERNK